MLINLIRKLQGYLKIRITGYSPERFLNLCKNKKIQIWGLESSGNAYEMYMKVSGFRKLKPIIKKTKTRVIIIERYGFPFFLQKHRKRKIFFAGCFASIALVYILSFFIWNIDVTGNHTITDDLLFEFLNSKNIYHGMLKGKVDCEQITKDIRKEFNDIVWVSAALDGTNLLIEVKENTDTFQVSEQEENEPTDIVATKDGIIVSIITRSGVPQVSVGDEVKAGDVLVSGTIDVLNDSGEVIARRFVDSDADIMAETKVLYKEDLSVTYEEKEYTGKKYQFLDLQFGNYFWKLGYLKENKEVFLEQHTQEYQIRLKENFYLPLWFGTMEMREYKLIEKEYSKEEREQILEKQFERFCKELEEQNAYLIDKNLHITHNSKNSIAISEIKLQEPIGEKRKIIDLSSEPMVEYNGL